MTPEAESWHSGRPPSARPIIYGRPSGAVQAIAHLPQLTHRFDESSEWNRALACHSPLRQALETWKHMGCISTACCHYAQPFEPHVRPGPVALYSRCIPWTWSERSEHLQFSSYDTFAAYTRTGKGLPDVRMRAARPLPPCALVPERQRARISQLAPRSAAGAAPRRRPAAPRDRDHRARLASLFLRGWGRSERHALITDDVRDRRARRAPTVGTRESLQRSETVSVGQDKAVGEGEIENEDAAEEGDEDVAESLAATRNGPAHWHAESGGGEAGTGCVRRDDAVLAAAV
ncbi:hypothetical protein GGX14DRAFT_620457 [Mycena pura]|uniref:Uncharacterized protein n=1 Tax=Mycena pura TaxID=153505 RepID=A0AAD6VHV7_9AGAR|nr:hypothetical protein GGX14DRAFT_620457 [Mycena pura]